MTRTAATNSWKADGQLMWSKNPKPFIDLGDSLTC